MVRLTLLVEDYRGVRADIRQGSFGLVLPEDETEPITFN